MSELKLYPTFSVIEKDKSGEFKRFSSANFTPAERMLNFLKETYEELKAEFPDSEHSSEFFIISK
jgi:hypothetical protein